MVSLAFTSQKCKQQEITVSPKKVLIDYPYLSVISIHVESQGRHYKCKVYFFGAWSIASSCSWLLQKGADSEPTSLSPAILWLTWFPDRLPIAFLDLKLSIFMKFPNTTPLRSVNLTQYVRSLALSIHLLQDFNLGKIGLAAVPLWMCQTRQIPIWTGLFLVLPLFLFTSLCLMLLNLRNLVLQFLSQRETWFIATWFSSLDSSPPPPHLAISCWPLGDPHRQKVVLLFELENSRQAEFMTSGELIWL